MVEFDTDIPEKQTEVRDITIDDWKDCFSESRDEMDEKICKTIKDITLEILEENPIDELEEVNSGFCYLVSDKTYSIIGKPDNVDIVERHDSLGANHGYIRYRGKFFDAEVPTGVGSVGELPFMQRYPINIRGEGLIRSDGETNMGLTEFLKE